MNITEERALHDLIRRVAALEKQVSDHDRFMVQLHERLAVLEIPEPPPEPKGYGHGNRQRRAPRGN